MKVTLIDYTGKNSVSSQRYAAALLLYTKSTRLGMDPELFDKFLTDPWVEIVEGLCAMAETIPSNWEFVDYTWLIQGVSRGFTHQFVRTRHATFAQQTMRVLDMSEGPGWDYVTGPSIKGDGDLAGLYVHTMGIIAENYKGLIEGGAAIEDARGILPTNIKTNICVKMNLRTLVEMSRKRQKSKRVQNEYRQVVDAMIEKVLNVHGFVEIFLERGVDNSLDTLMEILEYHLNKPGTQSDFIRAMKMIDIIRSEG